MHNTVCNVLGFVISYVFQHGKCSSTSVDENKIIVLRPSKLIKMKRVEKDLNKLQSIYDLGVSDCTKKLDKIREYIAK